MKELHGIRLIIFDLDGVIVDTLPDLAAAVQKTAETMRCKPLTLEEAGGFVGGGAKRAFTTLLGEERVGELPDAMTFFRDYFTEHCADYSLLYPNVKEVLEHFFGKVKIGLATAKIRPATVKILETLGISKYFDILVTADEMERMKPDPQSINIILEKLAIAPHEAVMVGDMKTDIMAGKAAGTATVAVSGGYGRLEDLQEVAPDILIDDILTLKDTIAV